MSFLNAEEPGACDLVTDFGLDLVWHPSLGMQMGGNAIKIFDDEACALQNLQTFKDMGLFEEESGVLAAAHERNRS